MVRGAILGLRIAGEAIASVFRDVATFSRMALGWTLVVFAALIVTMAIIAPSEGRSVDIAVDMVRLRTGDLNRSYALVTALTGLIAEIAVTVGWMRFVLLGEQPSGFLTLPAGTARYLSRTVLLLFVFVALCLPGVLLGAAAGGFSRSTMGGIVATVIVALGAIVALYLCIRVWLIFPAAAIGLQNMDWRRSFRLTKGHTATLLISFVISYFGIFLPALIVSALPPLFGTGLVGGILEVFIELSTTYLSLAATAAAAGATAIIYRQLAPEGTTNTETIEVFT